LNCWLLGDNSWLEFEIWIFIVLLLCGVCWLCRPNEFTRSTWRNQRVKLSQKWERFFLLELYVQLFHFIMKIQFPTCILLFFISTNGPPLTPNCSSMNLVFLKMLYTKVINQVGKLMDLLLFSYILYICICMFTYHICYLPHRSLFYWWWEITWSLCHGWPVER